MYRYGVLRKLLSSGECLTTRSAYVVLLASVGAHVGVKMAAVGESFVAQMANVRAFARMNADVVNQARFCSKNFAASVALVVFHGSFRPTLVWVRGVVDRYVFHL